MQVHRQAFAAVQPAAHAVPVIVRTCDQQERWAQVWGEYAINSQQNTLRMTGTVQDITERRQSEEQLDRYRHTLEEQCAWTP